MEKEIRISTEHTCREDENTQTIILKMSGGSPYYGYIWINDICYTVRKGHRSITVMKEK
jgi:hypothetical protein